MEPNCAENGIDVSPAISNILETATPPNSEDSEVDRMESPMISSMVSQSSTEEANNSTSEPSFGTDHNTDETSGPQVFEMDCTRNHPTVDAAAPGSQPPATNNLTEKPRFVITSWEPVIIWDWRFHDDTCAICKRNLSVICMYCFTDTYDNKECMIVTGKCGHAFHEHCMDFWLKKSTTCPQDSTEWEEKLFLWRTAYNDHELKCKDAIDEDGKKPDVGGTKDESEQSQN